MGGFVTKGYGLSDLGQLFGERETVIRGWIERGLFGKKVRTETRISERRVHAFLIRHHGVYDLGCVDQFWAWALAFGVVIGVPPDATRESHTLPKGRGDSLFLRRRRRRQVSRPLATAAKKVRSMKQRRKPCRRAGRRGRGKHDAA